MQGDIFHQLNELLRQIKKLRYENLWKQYTKQGPIIVTKFFFVEYCLYL